MKNYSFLALFIFSLSIFFISCTKEEDYVPIEDILPIATNDVVSSTLTDAVLIPIIANDTIGDAVIASSVSLKNGVDSDGNGSLDNLIIANEGTWSANPNNGELTFTPIVNYVGNPTQISYTVKDKENNISNEAIVTINAEAIVTANIQDVPFTNLSQYNFFVGNIANQIPSLNVLEYEPSSSLFTDYAHKKRFVWMPTGVKANYEFDNKTLNFPIGTFLIKTFYYTTIQPNNSTKLIETRIMVRHNDGWKFYEYLWNDEQTDAILVTGSDFVNGSSKLITFAKPNNDIISTNYRIPSDAECFACHKINETATPIGVKPQNLNHNYAYSDGSKNQLQKMVELGYLTSYPSNVSTTVDYNDTTKSLSLRARSYLDINCAHCHQDEARCFYRPIRFPFSLSNIDTNVGICLEADEQINSSLTRIISPGNYNKSILHFRINSNDESERMPLLGRTIVHEEGVALIEQWINSMTQTCN